MPRPRTHPKRLALLALLWAVVGLSTLVTAVQGALLLAARGGEWQVPDIYRVTILSVNREASPFQVEVRALVDGEAQDLTFPRDDAADLRPQETLWVLDNCYTNTLRPGQFALSPQRVLVEYPLLPLALALLGLARLRRSAWGRAPEPPPGARTVFRDEMHLRAERFRRPAPAGDDAPPPEAP